MQANSASDSQLLTMDGTPTDRQLSSLASRISGFSTNEQIMADGHDEQSGSSLIQPEFDVNVTLADQQADPNSPLHSVKSFDELGLHPALLKGIYFMKFQKPSKIQERALPLMLANPPRNMIAQSQSGTGKTAAFVLTMLSRVDPTNPDTQAICLAPSRELARQIMDVVKSMGQFTTITTAFGIKDAVARDSKVNAQVVIGTPGTVMDLIKIGRRLDTKSVRVLVLDEADSMLDAQNLGEQCLKIRNMVPKTIQTLLFSATFPDRVRQFANRFAPAANEITLKKQELSLDAIRQLYMDCANEEAKYDVLVELYSLLTIGQSIIFVSRRDTADKIAARMTAEGHAVTSLHGQKETSERDAVMDAFRDGRSKVLITTNVIARGIDVMQVNMVINYDLPKGSDGKPDLETYIHRIGRTGRFGRKGISINFCHDKSSWEEMMLIQTALGREITRVQTTDYDEMEKVIKGLIKN